jgi:hypothetical protein
MEKRILHIGKEDTVKSLQEKFSSWYPYLRINFFRRGNGKPGSLTCFSPDVKMTDINKCFVDSDYDLAENTSISGLEKTFIDQFGLQVQVCRRIGNLWLGTRLSDHLTLKQQNELGEELVG